MERQYHTPVLLNEVVQYLNPRPGKCFIDATFGGGNYAKQMLKRGAVVLGIDRDPDALAHARECLLGLVKVCPGPQVDAPGEAGITGKTALAPRFTGNAVQESGPEKGDHESILVKADFAEIGAVARRFGFDQVDGIVLDLGVSAHQLETPDRGFSFRSDGPLDMRMDPETQKVTAAELINVLSIHELNNLFKNFGQESRAYTIARALVRARGIKPITRTAELAKIVAHAIVRKSPNRIHPATRVFQALRIAVNSELDSLKTALPQIPGLLKPGGVFVVLSFHSLEDRIVKTFFKDRRDVFRILVSKPIVPTSKEIGQNPRSRSAKMRVVVRL